MGWRWAARERRAWRRGIHHAASVVLRGDRVVVGGLGTHATQDCVRARSLLVRVRGKIMCGAVHTTRDGVDASDRNGGDAIIVQRSRIAASWDVVPAAAVVDVGVIHVVGGSRAGATELHEAAALEQLSVGVEVERSRRDGAAMRWEVAGLAGACSVCCGQVIEGAAVHAPVDCEDARGFIVDRRQGVVVDGLREHFVRLCGARILFYW